MIDLRIPGLKRGKRLTLFINGEKSVAHEGETVHAALIAAGVTAFGKTRKLEQPCGTLCGMGICYQCLVTINGVPDQRACMNKVAQDMEIITHGL
jgi:sarcosine oxidase subunit alpha